MSPLINSKLPQTGVNIFTVMSALAVEHNAINLGQGFPDYPMPQGLVDAMHEAASAGLNQYTHSNGFPALRQAIARKVQKLYGTDVNADRDITVTPGGTYALYTALTTILQKGDEVILFEPAYDCYIPQIELAGAVAIPLQLQFPEYRINWNEVRQHVNGRTKAIIINTPHNPTGTVLIEADLEELQSITDGTGIFVISDEVYEHLIFDGLRHESVLRYPNLLQRSFVIFSFGKVYNCTGWKLGYCIAPPSLMTEFRKIHQYNCFSCDTPKQAALASFLQHEAHYLQLGPQLQEKRDFFQSLMGETLFEALPSKGSYFGLYSYERISSEAEKDFAVRLTKEVGVVGIPLSAFYKNGTDNKVLRFCFAKKEETLSAAVERLASMC